MQTMNAVPVGGGGGVGDDDAVDIGFQIHLYTTLCVFARISGL